MCDLDVVRTASRRKETHAKKTHKTQTLSYCPPAIDRIVQGGVINRPGYLCFQTEDRNTDDWQRIVVLVWPESADQETNLVEQVCGDDG